MSFKLEKSLRTNNACTCGLVKYLSNGGKKVFKYFH